MPRLRPVKEQPKTEEETETVASSTGEQTTNVSPADETIVEIGEPEDEASTALQKQLEELKKSEEIQRLRADQAVRDREEALRRAREREAESLRFQNEIKQSQFNEINLGMAAAKAEAERAQQDIESAISLGDAKGQADAYRRLAKAESNLVRYEDGKAAIEAQKEQQQQVQTQTDPLERSGLPDSAKNWLRSHSDYLSEPRKNAKINALHFDLLDEGYSAYSPDYFIAVEERLGMRQPSQETSAQQEPAPRQRTSIVSAPVSREAPSSNPQLRNGQVRLTGAQREAAKMAGITEKAYAEQLQRINEMKANGSYGDRQ